MCTCTTQPVFRDLLLQPSLPHTPATSLPVLQPVFSLYTASIPGLVDTVFTMDSSDVKSCTVVFTLSKGQQVTPMDFAPHLEVVMGRILGFGTVGVGHVWHLTLTEQCYVQDILDQGDFEIQGRKVAVSKLSSALLSAVLFWLPFWVNHSDVIASLGKLLNDRVTCEYVRIDQKGFPGCYSTQRRIRSATDLTDLPYFIPVTSEGQTYRTFLFVPGRPPACFACNRIGHMKNTCPGTSNPDPPQPVEDIVSEPSSHALDVDPIAQSNAGDTEEDELFEATTQDKFTLMDRNKNKRPPSPVRHKGKAFTVIPPKTTCDSAKMEKAAANCKRTICYLIPMFRAEHISAQDMSDHIFNQHRYSFTLQRC